MSQTFKNVHTVTSANFEEEVLQATIPVLVDFTATWCGPCKQLGRLLEQIAAAEVGRVKVVAIDIDDAPDLAARHGVRSVPTVVAFDRGEKIALRVGVTSREGLMALLQTRAVA